MSILINPLYLIGPPVLLVVSIPLALFAVITTFFALLLLAIRVSVVYFELGIALLHAYLFPEPPKPLPKRPPPPTLSPPRARHRRSSSSSQDTAVPAARIHTKSGSSASLLRISDLSRDFEGVGGWRFYEGEGEEALWMGMNKRLELPIAMPRRHQRRHTGEDQRYSWSPEALRMGPVQSRSRTPAGQDKEADEYFPPQQVLRPLSTASEPLSASALHSRRASAGDSSSSSNNSNGSPSHSRRTSIAAKQTGE